MINRGGPSLVVRIADQTGAAPAGIARAFAAVRDSYDMPALNDEINALDGKVPGKVQLALYAAVQDLLLDRLVWFLRNVDLIEGPGRRGRALSRGHRGGCRARSTRRCRRMPPTARAARAKELTAGRRAGARWRAGSPNLPELAAAPDIVLIADRTGKPIAAIAATYFAAEAYLPARPRGGGGARHRGVGLFRPAGARPRARFDRRRRAAADRGDGRRPASPARPRSRPGSTPRKAEVERIRAAIHEIAGTGLTLSKLTVAASLLGDLVKG